MNIRTTLWPAGFLSKDQTSIYIFILTKLSPTQSTNYSRSRSHFHISVCVCVCVCVSIKMAVCLGSSSSSGGVIGVVLIFALLFAIVVEAHSPAPAPAPTSDGISIYTSFFLSLPSVDPKSLLFFLFGCSKCSLPTLCFLLF